MKVNVKHSINFNKQNQNVIRLSHYLTTAYNTFFIWKLNLKNIKYIPKYKSLIWRSFYTKKTQTNLLSKSLLLNFFFISVIIKQVGLIKFLKSNPLSFCGWSFFSFNTFTNYILLYRLLTNILVSNNEFTNKFNFNQNWLRYKPNNWVTIGRNEFYQHELITLPIIFLQHFFLVDGAFHGFQIRLNCQLFPSYFLVKQQIKQKFLQHRVIHPWYLKVLVCRLNSYPALLNYKYLACYANLNSLGYRVNLPWETVLLNEGNWQASPQLSRLITTLQPLLKIFSNGHIVELLIKLRWLEFIRKNKKRQFNRYVLISLYQNLKIILKLLKRSRRFLS